MDKQLDEFEFVDLDSWALNGPQVSVEELRALSFDIPEDEGPKKVYGPRPEWADQVAELKWAPGNNHGCTGHSVEIFPLDERRGIVLDAHKCGWSGHSWRRDLTPGTVVEIPAVFPDSWWPETPIWGRGDEPIARYGEWIGQPTSWKKAGRLVGYSSNELIDDDAQPQPDRTALAPSDLKVVSKPTPDTLKYVEEWRWWRYGRWEDEQS